MPDVAEGGLLARLAEMSLRRAQAARTRTPESALLRRIGSLRPAPELRLAARGFDLVAEIKWRTPSAGTLAPAGDPAPRARSYAAGGAAAISCLTEPDCFGGSLADLARVAEAVPIPVLRKDFIVDPYQVLEARAAGAAGVLAILALADAVRLQEIADAAEGCGLFVLFEIFGRRELPRLLPLLARCSRPLLGVNVRDLRTLRVDRERLAAMAPALPTSLPWVAESGIERPGDAARAATLGYRMALVGSALMRASDPRRAVAALLAAGRGAACASA